MTKLLSVDFPVRPRSFPFYYGWVALIVAIAGMLASAPGQTIGFSVFTDSLMSVSSLNRLELCSAYFLGTFGSSLMLKRVGVAYDRHGGRALAVLSGLGLGLMLFLFSQLGAVFHVVRQLTESPSMISSMIIMSLAFLGMRFLGQGVLMLSSRNLIGKWFQRRRGMVSAIAGLTMSVGFSLVPPFFLFLIEGYGWSLSYQVLSILMICFVVFAWIFYRDNPEECGLRIDGRASESDSGQPSPLQMTGIPLSEARQTLAFWSTCLGLSLHALMITAISFHIVDIGATSGVSKEAAIAIFVPIALSSGFFDLLTGWLADHVPVRYLLCFMMFGCLTGFIGVAMLGQTIGFILAVLGLGISNGCYGSLSNLAIPNFFGRKYMGEISGYQLSCLVLATSIGPIFFAACVALFDNYRPALYLAAAIGLINAWLSLRIKATAPVENS